MTHFGGSGAGKWQVWALFVHDHARRTWALERQVTRGLHVPTHECSRDDWQRGPTIELARYRVFEVP